MLTRRRFLSGAAAGAATLSRFGRLTELHAADVDLLIKGGRVIDPSRGFDQIADVAIAAGKISAVSRNIHQGAAAMIDAT
jgi:dihydroorotase